MNPLLLLWDIDGTLLQRASTEHVMAMHRALREVHGPRLAVEDVRGVEVAGRTDGAIARDLLLAVGVAPARIDDCVEEVARAVAEGYEELCPADLSDRVAPGVPAMLDELAGEPERFRFSLVTGNFEPVARLKLARAGIGDHFDAGQGAFGTDAEEREALPPLARARAAVDGGEPWPRERTVVIGDTPRDIACARADGLRVIAIATGSFRPDELRAADHVATEASELAAILRSMAG